MNNSIIPINFVEYVLQEERQAVVRVRDLRRKYRELRDEKFARRLASQYNYNQYAVIDHVWFEQKTRG